MHPRLSLNTLSCATSHLADAADLAARLGFAAISPTVDDIAPLGGARAAALLRDGGLRVATLTHLSFAFADAGAATSAAIARLDRTIELAATLGAASVTLTTGGRGELPWDRAAERFAASMAPCAERARAVGVALAIEPTSPLYADVSIAHRLADTLALARAAGIGVTTDLFACWTDADIEATLAEAAAGCAVVQVGDHVLGDRGLPCRAVPGDGAIPLGRLFAILVAAGFAGWFDLEIIGPRLAAEGIETGLRRSGTVMGRLLAAAGLPG